MNIHRSWCHQSQQVKQLAVLHNQKKGKTALSPRLYGLSQSVSGRCFSCYHFLFCLCGIRIRNIWAFFILRSACIKGALSIKFYADLALKFLQTWLRGKNQCKKCFFFLQSNFFPLLSHVHMSMQVCLCVDEYEAYVCVCLCANVCAWVSVSERNSTWLTVWWAMRKQQCCLTLKHILSIWKLNKIWIYYHKNFM